MKTVKVIRLWRVEWVHRNGYQAPYSYVEAENRKEAAKLLNQIPSRLKEFPESWSWRLLKTGLIWNSRKNTWVEEEISLL